MHLRPLILAAVATLSLAGLSIAQPTGLDALNDDALLNDLAQRGLTPMLERAFEINNTPEKKRDAIRASAALNRLAQNVESLSAAQRREIIDRVAAGVSEILPTLNDPAQLTRQAEVLIKAGVELDVNTLEYWGESTTTQAQLRPVVEAVIAILERAKSLATAEIEKLSFNADATDEKTIAKIESLEAITQYADQTRAMAGYYLALCLESSNPRRAETAEKSLAFLADYDFEENPALKNLKVVLGKLNMVAGKFDAAREAFDFASRVESPTPEGMDEATFAKQENNLTFEARYFRVVVELLANDAAAARKQFDALLEWEGAAGLAEDESIVTANMLLENRLLRSSGSDADHQKASALLIKLLEKRPELETQVMTQLRATITSETPVATLEPLLLRSLMSDAHEQILRAEHEPNFKPDPKTVTRGVEAAREMISRAKRGGGAGIDSTLLGNARFLLAVLLEAQGDRIEAARMFLQVAADHRDRLELAKAALNNAQRLFAQLGGINSEEPAVTGLYDQILPLSIGEPFNQKELCYDWAYRLQQIGRDREAVEFYRQVARSDRRYAGSRYYLMVALHEELDTLQSGNASRREICEEILQLADEVRSDATKQLLTASPKDRPVLQQRLARTLILASDIARTELRNPQKAIELLTDVEQQVKGLPDETQLLGEAMFTRIQANMQAGHSDVAVQELVELLNKSGGEQGATIVFNMLSKLEADFSLAQNAGDRNRMAKLQSDRAALTPYLVSWSENNARAEVAKFAYSYRVYDAETQRLAAEFLDDPVQRASKLQSALKLFESLDTDAGRQQYKASRSTPDRLGYDPQVGLGLARLRFALGDWPGARDGFARLLSDRVLGTPITSVTDAGQVRQVDNEMYWEATARLIRSKINASDSVDSVKTFLREQYVRWGDRVGGTKWKAEFDSLRQELIPDFVPDVSGFPDSLPQ